MGADSSFDYVDTTSYNRETGRTETTRQWNQEKHRGRQPQMFSVSHTAKRATSDPNQFLSNMDNEDEIWNVLIDNSEALDTLRRTAPLGMVQLSDTLTFWGLPIGALQSRIIRRFLESEIFDGDVPDSDDDEEQDENDSESRSASLSPVYRRPMDDPAPSRSVQTQVMVEPVVLLVQGFIRIHAKDVPSDIMNLCVLWYKSGAYFLGGSKGFRIAGYGAIMQQTSDSCGSCYGAMAMPSLSNLDLEYKVTLRIKAGDAICLGIDDARRCHLEDSFTASSKSKHYGYLQGGPLFSWDTTGKPYGCAYQRGDVIVMRYNPCKAVLRFAVNGEDQGQVENVYQKKGLSYRLCVTSFGRTASVELIPGGVFD